MKVEKLIEYNNTQYMMTLETSSNYGEENIYFKYKMKERQKGKIKWIDSIYSLNENEQNTLNALFNKEYHSKLYELLCKQNNLFADTFSKMREELAENYKQLIINTDFK